MAHALEGYDGHCRQIHGHSYRLFVTVGGVPCDDPKNPKYGMVMDFGDLKKIVNRLIVDRYDHALVLRATPESLPLIESMRDKWVKVEISSYQPTCENMLMDFATMLRCELPQHIKLMTLKLYETEKSYAEWCVEDNSQ